MLPANNIETAAGFEFADASENVADNTPANDIPELVADDGSYLELSAAYGDDAVTALATLTGITVGFVSAGVKILSGDACKKIARFVRFCDAFSIPVITFVDSEKFCCLKSAARVSSAYAEATTAKISVITGEAYGALYVALAGTGSNADITFAYPNASVSHLIHMHLLLLCLVMRLARNLKVLLIHRLIRKHLLLSSKQKTALYSRLLQMAMLKMLSHHQQQEQSLRLHLICLLAREYKDFQRSTITCLSDKFLNILRFSKGRFII